MAIAVSEIRPVAHLPLVLGMFTEARGHGGHRRVVPSSEGLPERRP
jgi:hypothetical protein